MKTKTERRGKTVGAALWAAAVVGTVAASLAFPAGTAWAQDAKPAAGAPAQQSGPPPGDPLGPDVFLAISERRTADLKAALAKGAKVEGRNWLEITPLIWAAGLGNLDACKVLLDAGADINTPCRFGSALAFAEMSGNQELVRFLIGRGAKVAGERADGITPLMTAAETGRIEVLRLLLAHAPAGAVNAADEEGNTPLIYAARRGQTAAARFLLGAGAKVDARAQDGRTALMNAAAGGYAATADLLVKAKADVNARDKAGNSALHLAARYGADPAVVLTLLRGGADREATDAKGRTAYEIAQAHESPAGVTIALRPAARLKAAADRGAGGATTAVPMPVRARQAVERALPLIEGTTKAFSDKVPCASCHHQGLGLMATGAAQDRGFAIDKAVAAAQTRLILDGDKRDAAGAVQVVGHPEVYKMVPGVDMGELTPMIAFVYNGLLAHNEKGGEIEAALAVLLASQQAPTGEWNFHLRREPVQASAFTTTALSVRVIKNFLPADRADEAARRIAAAREWLKTAKAITSEDKAFRLLGLKWAGADAATIAKATAELKAAQRPDGGWAQFPAKPAGTSSDGDGAYLRSDAYATGQALYALNVGGGVPTTAPAYRDGVRFLVRTQDDDGSWFVVKRAVPVNTYFDTGFPHGQSQYVSYSATCWAIMALSLAADTPKPAVATKVAAVAGVPVRR